MSTEDKLASLRDDVKELKAEVRELRALFERVRALETKFEERDRHRSQSTETATVKWLKWAVIVALIVGVGGLILGAVR